MRELRDAHSDLLSTERGQGLVLLAVVPPPIRIEGGTTPELLRGATTEGTWRTPRPRARRRQGDQVGVILVVLATTAFVIAVVVAVAHGLNDVNKAVNRAEANSRRAAAIYPRIKRGTTAVELRRRLGKPDDVEADGYVNGGVCWYYGNALSSNGKLFDFCFKRGKLYSKSRL